MSYLALRLKQVTPAPLKSWLKRLGLRRVLAVFKNKYAEELEFQMDWAKEFVENKSRVLEYWRKYRYLDEISDICKFDPHTRVLDVGCGISTVLHYIEGERYGIDPLASEYRRFYSYPTELQIVKGFGEDIPFPDESFDVVFCSNVIDHVTAPQKSLEEIRRVLKPEGKFVLTVEVFSGKQVRDPAHPHCFLKKDVTALLEGKFKPVMQKESVWIGTRNYVHGSRRGDNKEFIAVSEKVAA